MNKHLRTFFLLLFTFTLSTASAQWTWLNPKPSGNTGKSITFVNEQTGFIVNGSQLLQTKDAGATWDVKQSITSGNEIRFRGEIGFIAGDFGNVYRSVDKGESWQKLTVNTQENLNTVNILHPDTIYITSDKSLIKTTDGGKTWSTKGIEPPQTDPYYPNQSSVTKSFFINSKVGHAACKGGKILKTIDGGESWYITESVNSIPSDYFTIHFVNSKVGFASKQHNTIVKTTDGGETWTPLSNRLVPDAAYSLYFLNENVGFFAGDNGAIHKTTDGGHTWQWISFQNARIDATSIYGIHFINVNVGYATGARGRIVKTTDGGITWTEYAFTYNNIGDMAFPSSTTGYALGSELYKTTDKGATWKTVNTGLDESMNYYRLAQFFSADTGYVVAHEGFYSNSIDQLFRTNDGGNTWTKLSLHTYGIRISSIYFLNNRIGYVCTDSYSGNGFLKTVDGGKTWQRISSFTGATKMHFIDVNNGFAILNGDLYRTTNGGLNWTKIYEVYGSFTAFSFVNDKVGYISAEYGVVLKTKDGGATWEELKTEYDHLKAIAFYSENVGYVTGEYGKNFRTSDGGYTWESVSMPSLITKLVITEDKELFAAGNYGRILKSAVTYDEYSLKALPASDVTADGAVLTGVIASNNEEIANIRIEYGKGMFFDKRIDLTPARVQANSAEKYTHTLKDLEPDTEYFFRIRATYKGTERSSQFIQFKTRPAFSLNYGMAYNVTTNSAELSWHVASNLGEITNIQFEYATDNSFTNPSSIAASPGTVPGNGSASVVASLQQLKPGTRYYGRLKITYKSKEYYGIPFSFNTRHKYLISIQPPVVTETAVRWGARVETNHGDVTKLMFEYGKSRDFGQEAVVSPDVVPNNAWRNVQASLTDLEPETVYYYRLKALQGDKAIYSTTHMFRASGGVLIEADKAEQVTGTSAILTGFIAPQGSIVSNIQIEYGETQALGKTVAATPNFLYTGTGTVQAEVQDLVANTVYYFRIKGTVNGAELYSVNASFATAAPTGISDEEDRKLRVYPNPTRDRLTFSHQEIIERIEVYDHIGKRVLTALPSAAHYVLDLSRQVPGVYHIRVYHKANVHIRKVIKL
ncbi:YCF48-related protein [Pontibacter vulgaris]|uniref:YCF48-related protein n=1 Tax=Pontibacter vulgaris TaxID=2905679 RepID=UPI001FA77958|nr:YCF48-related protein [Pontibacter vulgaris]